MKIDCVHQRVTFGGVTVNDGDLVLGDADGVVVIPHEVEVQVLIGARTRAAKESVVLSELLAGESLRVVWDTYSVL
jgi:regulator of RNase E activity RraA